MQHFITDSNWDARKIIDQAAMNTGMVLPKRKLTGLIIDETGTVKKGDKSVGVGWQYCGNVGKTANSQVSVMACLSNGDFASLVDARLFLPQDWCKNSKRCDEAGIPKDQREFKSKPELAYEIIKHQLDLGVEFDFVGGDGLYGNDSELTKKLDDLGCIYMLDVHKDQTIYLEKPELVIPNKKPEKGRPPVKAKPDKKCIRADHYLEQLSSFDWVDLKVRNTAKGMLRGKYHFAEVFTWNKKHGIIIKQILVIRKLKTKSGAEIKYSITNANLVQYTEKALAYMQAQRFFIEHCIKESKQVLGLSQFQTRKWRAWHHQVALNIMTACFILKEKIFSFNDLPLLSAWDIKIWICFKLQKEKTDQDIIDMMFYKHLERQVDINKAYKKEIINNLSK